MIYTQLFGFTHLPFHDDITTSQLFQCQELDELHSRLQFLLSTCSIGLLTGEPGSGKSTALRRWREDLHPEQVKTVYLCDTDVNPADFCRLIALELGLEPQWSRAMNLRAIHLEIQRLVQERKLTVLVILDEAHGLRPDVLNLLPKLTNFDWDAKPHLALILAGQSGLRAKLRMAHLEALAQRITVRFVLQGFDRDTSQRYIEHRLRLAGIDRPLFTEPAFEALFNASQGIMRRTDTLAHCALAVAATSRAKLVEPDHVILAAEEIRA